MIKKFTLTLTILLWALPLAAYEMVMIQAVSASRKSFVTRNGKDSGIHAGKEATFTTRNVTIVAKAVEVTREYTLWEINDKDTTVPFERLELVTFNNSIESIWYQINAFDRMEQKKRKIEQKISSREKHLVLKGSVTRTLSESITQVNTSEANSRQANSFSGLFFMPLSDRLSWGIGGRMDNEVADNPLLDIPTTRYLGLLSIEYHFPDFKKKKQNFYAAATLGYGTSTTTIDTITNKGIATLLPSISVGVQIPIKRNFSLLFEGSFESISMKEDVSDGTTQTTNLTNGVASVGLKIHF